MSLPHSVRVGPRLHVRWAMKSLVASMLLVLAACGGSSKSSTTPPADDSVDPTVPSWLPASCIAYHKAVVQALDCAAVEQATRDRIKATFDETSVSWKAEEHASAARIEEVGAACTDATDAVRADIAGSCI